MSWTIVASMVQAVPDELGSAICTSPLNSGLIRSAQQAGGVSLRRFESSVL